MILSTTEKLYCFRQYASVSHDKCTYEGLQFLHCNGVGQVAIKMSRDLNKIHNEVGHYSCIENESEMKEIVSSLNEMMPSTIQSQYFEHV